MPPKQGLKITQFCRMAVRNDFAGFIEFLGLKPPTRGQVRFFLAMSPKSRSSINHPAEAEKPNLTSFLPSPDPYPLVALKDQQEYSRMVNFVNKPEMNRQDAEDAKKSAKGTPSTPSYTRDDKTLGLDSPSDERH
jgi:hypothetical protein